MSCGNLGPAERLPGKQVGMSGYEYAQSEPGGTGGALYYRTLGLLSI